MAEGKRGQEWDQTATLISNIRNALGDKSASPEQFHPDHFKDYHRRELRRYQAKQRGANDANESVP